jgi:hypothetical protein
MTFESELQKRTIRTPGEGFADGAQRNARIAAMSTAKRAASKSNKEQLIKQRTADAEKRTKEVMQMSKEETVTEAKMTKKFVFDKPYQPLVKVYSNHDTDHLKDMHKRWSESHQRNMKGSMDTNTSEKLLAVNHVLKSRGEDMKMPEHKNLGMHVMGEETNTEKREKIKNVARMDDVEPTSEKSTLSKTDSIKTKIVEGKPTMSLPNFGLSASLIAAARQIVEKKDDVKLTGGNTPVETSPETKDRTDDDEDTSTSKKKKKLDPVGKEDDDIDNDGDVDKSDSYLKNRRKAIGKAIKEDEQLDEVSKWRNGPEGKTWSKTAHADDDDYAYTKDFFGGAKEPNIPSHKATGKVTSSTYADKVGARSQTPATGPRGSKAASIAAAKKLRDRSGVGFGPKGKLPEEVEELDELSKKTLGLYVKKAGDDATKHSYIAGKTGDVDTAEKATKRIRGIAKATDKLITQGDFTSDELARIDEIAQSIFEMGTDGLDSDKKYAKGDVTNAVLSDEKKPEMDDQHKHPMQQLEKIAHSVEGREPYFEHKDGSKTKVGKTLARQLKSVHDSMKTTQEKNKFADSVHASRDSMRAAADKHL